MVRRTRKNAKSPQLFGFNRLTVLLVIALCALLALWYVLHASMQSPSNSVEVSFTDDSAHGMEIVPASCASSVPPPSAPGANGYALPNGIDAQPINYQGYDFCVSNGSGSEYFVPANSSAELGSFYNAASNGSVPGVSTQSP